MVGMIPACARERVASCSMQRTARRRRPAIPRGDRRPVAVETTCRRRPRSWCLRVRFLPGFAKMRESLLAFDVASVSDRQGTPLSLLDNWRSGAIVATSVGGIPTSCARKRGVARAPATRASSAAASRACSLRGGTRRLVGGGPRVSARVRHRGDRRGVEDRTGILGARVADAAAAAADERRSTSR